MRERIPHIVTKGKNKEKPQNVIYCDSESRVDNLKHRPYLMCATFCRYKKKGQRYERDYSNVKDFWDEAATFAQYKTTTYIYAHNMGYDMIATGAIPALVDNGFILKSFFQKGGTIIFRFYYDEGEEGKTKTIILLSTTNFFADKLANLAKVFGLEKIDIDKEYGKDYNNISYEEALIYCKQDVKIIEVAMEELFRFIEEEDLGCVAKTAAGQSFNAFRHRFMEHEIYIHTNENATKLERESYYGGRVECWRLGEYAEDEYYYIDVNSMYPYVMANFSYPVKLLGHKRYSSLYHLQTYLKNGRGVIAKVLIETKEAYFPKRTKNKLIFPVGRFWTVLATSELKFALENNLIKKVGELSYYEMQPIFKPFVDYFYNKRLEAKANNNDVWAYLFKLILNTNYGKWGQQADQWEEIGSAPSHMVRHEILLDHVTKELCEVRILGGTVFKKGSTDEAFNSFCAISSEVTSHARMHLLKHILISGKETVFYMDTDSLVINKEGYEKLKPFLDSKILGKMKMEGVLNYIKINAPKDYILKGIINNKEDEITKRKGISKDARELTIIEYIDYIEKMRKTLPKAKFIETLQTLKKEDLTMNIQWPKMNTFLNKGDLSQFENINRVKILSRKYNKGTVLKDGKVIPFEIYEN